MHFSILTAMVLVCSSFSAPAVAAEADLTLAPSISPDHATDSASYCTDKAKKADERMVVMCDMIDAWEKLDWNRAASLFAEDGVLHSMMLEPVVGREAITQRFRGVGSSVTRFRFRILALAPVGDAIFFERVDVFEANGHSGTTPVVGVLQIKGGKIASWREYFDRAQFLRELRINENLDKGTWSPAH